MAEKSLHYGVLTVSDTCFNDSSKDRSIAALKKIIENNGGIVKEYHIVPDEKEKIKEKLVSMCGADYDVILTTGGTGFTPRDVTPEATLEVIEKSAPGLQIAMTMESLKITPYAMLSRGVCGIRGRTVIINLPGSPKAAVECYQVVVKALGHAVDQLRGHTSTVKAVHSAMQSAGHHHSCSGGHHMNEAKIEQIARRPRHSPYPLIAVTDAITTVLKFANPLGTETRKVNDSLGSILAEDIYAKEAVPPFRASIKDGYAVIASDTTDIRMVMGCSNAGDLPMESVVQGRCMRVSTGAPVPPGADAVVQVEDTELVEEAEGGIVEVSVRILVAPRGPGQDIRPPGSDIELGQLLLRTGSLLGSAELGLLASVGISRVLCHRSPVVGVLSTGDELLDPEAPSEKGKIRDCNRTTLLHTLLENRFNVVDLGIARDNLPSLREKLALGLSSCDLLVTSGGVSMGEKDLLREVLMTDYQATVHFGRVFMKPGKPTTFATLTYKDQGRLVLGLPGNPVSAMVTCQLYVVPALRKMAGYNRCEATRIRVKLRTCITLDPRPEYHRCILHWEKSDPVPIATSTGGQISSRLLSMSGADALLELPPATKELIQLAAGSMVDAMVIGRI